MKQLLSFVAGAFFRYSAALVMIVFAAVIAINYHMRRHPDLGANDISNIIQKRQSSDVDGYRRAIESLAQSAPENASKTILALLHSERKVRYAAVSALRKADMSPLQTVPALVFAMRDEYRWVRWSAAWGLQKSLHILRQRWPFQVWYEPSRTNMLLR